MSGCELDRYKKIRAHSRATENVYKKNQGAQPCAPTKLVVTGGLYTCRITLYACSLKAPDGQR